MFFEKNEICTSSKLVDEVRSYTIPSDLFSKGILINILNILLDFD